MKKHVEKINTGKIGILAILLTFLAVYTHAQDTTLQFPINNPLDPSLNTPQSFDFGDPSSIEKTVVYDPVTGQYMFVEKLSNGLYYRYPSMMTLEEYLEYERKKSTSLNWQKKIDEQTEEGRPFELPINVGSKLFADFFFFIRGGFHFGNQESK